ncbi:type IV pilin protein [Zeimonas arvi]|uniref:Type IV pilin protein n=1 Tax=Zeimonas arvi TaxID=2498847 RepID=A0A5C8P644_9BURK|nr:type IV pilin protein [Zeimonas arvi]TXL68725.1 type IV pilin protein [Zeimonas arvi]
MNPCSRPRRTPAIAGFTLIELMITVAIVAILASVAYPSYVQYVLRSNRAAAQGVMTDLASRQHQFFVDTRAYSGTVAGLRTSVPADVAANYTITIALDAGPPAGFTLTATPQGKQASEACGTLTIDEAGAKAPADCW